MVLKTVQGWYSHADDLYRHMHALRGVRMHAHMWTHTHTCTHALYIIQEGIFMVRN